MLHSDCVDGLTEETLKSKYILYKFVFFLQEEIAYCQASFPVLQQS